MNTTKTVWIEKYRPYNIKNIIQPDIKLLISQNNISDLPHLLFYGNPGTGKTTTALSICKHIYTSNPLYSHIYFVNLKDFFFHTLFLKN